MHRIKESAFDPAAAAFDMVQNIMIFFKADFNIFVVETKR